MHQMRIRMATIKDFEKVLSLLLQLWPSREINVAAIKDAFARGLDSQNDTYFCAEMDGSIIGFCSLTINNSLWQESSIGYIGELVVDTSFRGQGVGTDLLEVAMDAAKDKGCKRIELDAAFHRNDAHNFYEGLGFEKRAYRFSKEL